MKPAKKEEFDGGSDDNVPLSAINRGPKKEVEDSDDDEVPLAISRAKKKSAVSSITKAKKGGERSNERPSKVKKEEAEDSKESKKGGERSNERPSKVKKKEAEDSKESKKRGERSNEKPFKVKKEEAEDLKESKKRSNERPSKVKKEEAEDSKEDLNKVNKGGNKKENRKGKENQDKKSNSDKVKKVKAKKVYHLPGQKHDPPEERDPLRVFYESLYHQIPNSEMALIWMMEWGLLPEDEAKKIFEKKKKNGVTANKSPAANNSSIKGSLDTSNSTKGKMVNTKCNSAKGKKRKAGSSESEDDFVASPKLNPKKKQKVSN